jgi:hypothetical protein
MAIAIEPGKITVKLFGAKLSPNAFAIRNFLQRSVVAFEWIELQSDEEARRRSPETWRATTAPVTTTFGTISTRNTFINCHSRSETAPWDTH